MAYCANYKGHKPFSGLHQRELSPLLPFLHIFHTFQVFIPSLFLSSPCLSHDMQYDNIEAKGPYWGPTSCWRPFGARASWLCLLRPLRRSICVTHADDPKNCLYPLDIIKATVHLWSIHPWYMTHVFMMAVYTIFSCSITDASMGRLVSCPDLSMFVLVCPVLVKQRIPKAICSDPKGYMSRSWML